MASKRCAEQTEITAISFSQSEMCITFGDGRRLSVPLENYPTLLAATPDQRENWEIIGNHEGLHWPDTDEDLSVASLLSGNPAVNSNHPRAA